MSWRLRLVNRLLDVFDAVILLGLAVAVFSVGAVVCYLEQLWSGVRHGR